MGMKCNYLFTASKAGSTATAWHHDLKSGMLRLRKLRGEGGLPFCVLKTWRFWLKSCEGWSHKMCWVELNTQGCLQTSVHDWWIRKQANINNSYTINSTFLTFEAGVLQMPNSPYYHRTRPFPVTPIRVTEMGTEKRDKYWEFRNYTVFLDQVSSSSRIRHVIWLLTLKLKALEKPSCIIFLWISLKFQPFPCEILNLALVTFIWLDNTQTTPLFFL